MPVSFTGSRFSALELNYLTPKVSGAFTPPTGTTGGWAQQPDPRPAQTGAADGWLRSVHLCLQLLGGGDWHQPGYVCAGEEAGGQARVLGRTVIALCVNVLSQTRQVGAPWADRTGEGIDRV